MTTEFANKVYDILVNICGAWEGDRDSFIYYHCETPDDTNEWRFCGDLGFGGKYRSGTNSVDCYNEDLNNKRKKIIEKTNEELNKIS